MLDFSNISLTSPADYVKHFVSEKVSDKLNDFNAITDTFKLAVTTAVDLANQISGYAS